MGLGLVPFLHGYAACDRVIRKLAGNFGMACHDKLTPKALWWTKMAFAVLGKFL
jgi:hypothetical protein